MKQMVTMQDLSCLGKCSLTVVLPVISAMGVACAALPTAVLSTHTAFPGPAVTDLSGAVPGILDHWAELKPRFDGILTGYLANPAQAELALELVDRFAGPDTLVVVDPAMGDHGRLYSGMGPEMAAAHGKLCARADLILPNLTEAAWLSGMEYREDADAEDCRELCRRLRTLGCGSVMLTGFRSTPDRVGFFWSDGSEDFAHTVARLPRSCHGTGDIFAAVTMGGLLRGMTAPNAGRLAAEFVHRAIAATGEDSRYGVAFEGELGWLAQQVSQPETRRTPSIIGVQPLQ